MTIHKAELPRWLQHPQFPCPIPVYPFRHGQVDLSKTWVRSFSLEDQGPSVTSCYLLCWFKLLCFGSKALRNVLPSSLTLHAAWCDFLTCTCTSTCQACTLTYPLTYLLIHTHLFSLMCVPTTNYLPFPLGQGSVLILLCILDAVANPDISSDRILTP